MDPNNPFRPQFPTEGAYVPHFPTEEFGADFDINLHSDADEFSPPPNPPSKPKGKKVSSKSYRGSGSRGRGSGRGGKTPKATESEEDEEAPAGYTEAETEVLARCWADVGQDSIVGNNQTKGTYWLRILEKYRALRPEGTQKRNSQKLRTHWDRVKNLLAEFQQLYKECEMQYRSGESDADVLARALNQWQVMKGAPFKHFETWRIVKDHPKFVAVYSAKYGLDAATKRTKTGESGSYSTSAGESAPGMGASQSGSDTSSRLERPMGRDAAKAAARGKKKVGSSSGMSDTAEQIAETNAAMRSAVSAFQEATDYATICKNTDKMPPHIRAFHERRVEEIKKKYGWEF